MNEIKDETLTHVLSKMLGGNVTNADHQTKQLQGGSLGDVRLVTGMAETAGGGKLPYQVVWKTQKKWERPGDLGSWRREYDLYASGLGLSAAFTDSLRWPVCYHAEDNDGEIQLWTEYIDGVSGKNLTVEMLEYAAAELGRFQGKIHARPEFAQNITCLGDTGFIEREHAQWHKQSFTYEFLTSDKCRLPVFLKQTLKENKIRLYDGKSFEYGCLRSDEFDVPEHLRRMLIDIDDNSEEVFHNIRKLPVILCHRDFWLENIFCADGKIRLIDWDTAGWGFICEDIASLIADETDAENLGEYFRRLVPAYRGGLSKYMDIPRIDKLCVPEMIIIKFGYRILQEYMFTQSSDVKNQQIAMLQKIYEMKNFGFNS